MPKAKFDITDIAGYRRKLGVNQQTFWASLGVTQSGGSAMKAGAIYRGRWLCCCCCGKQARSNGPTLRLPSAPSKRQESKRGSKAGNRRTWIGGGESYAAGMIKPSSIALSTACRLPVTSSFRLSRS